MKKVIAAVLVVVLLLGGAAFFGMSVLGSTLGTLMAVCQPRGDGAQGELVVVGDLPAVDGFTDVQVRNAAVIVSIANQRGLGAQGARVGIITALQESGLRNLANAGKFRYPARTTVMTAAQWAAIQPFVASSVNYPNDGVAPGDWDSIGLFQGRPSAGWGGQGSWTERITNLLNPSYTAGRFFDALVKIDGWQQMRPAAAAQAVQRSAYPDAYDKHWEKSGVLVQALTGVDVSNTSGGPCAAPVSNGPVTADGWTKPITNYKKLTSPFGMRFHPVDNVWKLHAGMDISAARGTPFFAAADGLVVKAGAAGSNANGLQWVVIDHGGGVVTRYLHSDPGGIFVKPGQRVTAGQQIAAVGMSGKTTGPHLHFEVVIDGKPVNPLPFLEERGITF
ncbi:M23 family metallopeptidase [Cellulomonas sp. HD19AZ1]|uniref:M23 family metallopeptidase n=1 Tax=Cellulomonas sp. HD19AZ1 TaxID=2559593 RepID=UPI0010714748|nr:M23 family metallopeptidase [Cellulomonas sp. HD19AZ1]TFH68155.1 M23 family metallopeptidase [Cellulomonas sp. HD19AZ1]